MLGMKSQNKNHDMVKNKKETAVINILNNAFLLDLSGKNTLFEMFVTTASLLFLIKLRWPKHSSLYDSVKIYIV